MKNDSNTHFDFFFEMAKIFIYAYLFVLVNNVVFQPIIIVFFLL